MVGHRGSSAGSHLTDPTSPIPSHCASIVVTSTLRVNCSYLKSVPCAYMLSVSIVYQMIPFAKMQDKFYESSKNMCPRKLRKKNYKYPPKIVQ